MVEKIELRISEHINAILIKDTLTHEDYMTLNNELYRLKQKEREIKFDEENKERSEIMHALFSDIIKTPIVP